MQSFTIWLRHIEGRKNVVADWMSRMYHLEEDEPIQEDITIPEVQAERKEPEYYLRQVHGGRMLHWGARRTWKLLNKHFPGHKIPYRVVEDFVSMCPICQKDRIGMTECIRPLIRHIKPPH